MGRRLIGAKKYGIGVLFFLVATLLGTCAKKPTVVNILETTISGRVVDTDTGKPLAGATVSSEPVTEQVLTNADGSYVLRANVEIGKSYRITATATGYTQNSTSITAREGENRIVDLGLSPSVPKLKVTPDSLFFDATTQSISVVIENVGTGVLNWTATDPSEAWLRIVPLKGQASKQASTIAVTVDRSRIDADGTYRTNVIITSDGGTATIPIIVVVEGKAAAPRLNVSPVSLAFGTTSDRRNIGITNTGSGELTWQASSPQAWIKATPDSGLVTTGSAQIVIDIDRSLLTPGEHTGSLDVVSNGGSFSVTITVSIPTPVISLSAREVDFRTDLETITLEVANTGTGDLTWDFKNDLSWLTIKPTQGVTTQVATPVVFSIQRQGLEAGSYDGKVSLTSNSTSEPVIDLRVKMQVLERPALSVSQDSLSFNTQAEELTLDLSNTNNGTLNWQVEASESWLLFNHTSGELAKSERSSVTVTAQRKGLAAGVYQAQITVSSNGGKKSVPVKMEVGQNPVLSVDKQSLDFGTDSISQTIGIRNTGTGRLTWNVQETAEWLGVSTTAGTTLDETDQITLTVDRSKLLAGSYTTTVTTNSDGGNRQITVEMAVSSVPVLSISADSANFGLKADTLSLTITNLGNASMTWNLTKEVAWVEVVPSSGEIGPGEDTSIQVKVDRSTLPLGSYETTLRLSSNGGRKDINVQMVVPEAVLGFSPKTLDFGSTLDSTKLVLSNSGNIPLTWTIQEQIEWLEVVSTEGSTEPGKSKDIEVHISREGLTPSQYTGNLTINSNTKSGTTQVPVVMTVLENRPPVANAGPDQTVEKGTTVQLDGSSSGDPEGVALTYRWAAPTGINLSSTTSARPRFTASTAGGYRFTLIVSDGKQDSAPDEVVITVSPPINKKPIANAGADQTVEVGEVVQLNGTGSSDPDGDSITYLWTSPEGVALSSTEVLQPQFTATQEGIYRFTLVVNDGQVDSVPDEVTISVEDVANPVTRETVTVELPGGTTMEMVRIEPGTFTMGSPSSEQGRENDEGPQHQVTISMGFYLGKYEITQGQWLAVMGTEPWAGRDYVQENPENPAVYISWENIQAFVHELNQAAGDSLYRLPTEAEWEYACRAGTTTAWSAGDSESQLNDYAWYWDNAWNAGEEYAHEVGTKKPNPWGLYDMHGNAWEWVQDSFGLYSSRSQTDPIGPTTDSSHVGRGGGFARAATDARSANRLQDDPNNSQYIIFGGRLVRTEKVVSPSTPPNTSPVANAGPDQTVQVGDVVQLDGSGSNDPDGDALSYRWTAPSGISLSSATNVRPRFTSSAEGTYRFTLVVNDGQMDSSPDEVVIRVTRGNASPIANAGLDQTVVVGVSVQLDGSGSSDRDGDVLRYRWTTSSGVSLSSTTNVRPQFTANAEGTYRFTLVVNDGQVDSSPDEVVIVVIKNTAGAQITGQIEEESTADAEVTGTIEETTPTETSKGTAGAEIKGQIEEETTPTETVKGTAGAEIKGQIEKENTTNVEITGRIEDHGAVDAANKSLSLDGAGDYVVTTDSVVINTSRVTLEAWIYVTQASGEYKIIHSHAADFRDAFLSYQDSRIWWVIYDNTGAVHNIRSSTVSTNAWHHIAGVYDGTRLHLYLDGQEEMAPSSSENVDFTTPFTFAGNLYVGAHVDGAQQFFPGMIDEVRIWSRGLSSVEVQDQKDKELTGNESGLVLYYRFNDDGGSTYTKDLSSKANRGELKGDANVTASSLSLYQP